MTLKGNDYRLVSTVMKKVRKPELSVPQKMLLDTVVHDLGLVFSIDNPRFNAEKFMQECRRGER